MNPGLKIMLTKSLIHFLPKL